jgi:hypothetical protein
MIKKPVIDPYIPEDGSLQPGKIPEVAILPEQPGVLDVKIGVVPRKSVREEGDTAEIGQKTDTDEDRLHKPEVFGWGGFGENDISRGLFHFCSLPFLGY